MSPSEVSIKTANILKEIMVGYQIDGVAIKEPNDLLVEGKKIAGVLIESFIQKSIIKGYIIGIGINLNCSNDELANVGQPAVSLSSLKNRKIDINKFIKTFLETSEKYYN